MKIKILLLLMVFVICLLPSHVFAQCIEGNCSDGKGTFVYPERGGGNTWDSSKMASGKEKAP